MLGLFGGPGRLLGQFTDPIGIAIDQNNRMFVSEQYPWGRVQEFRYITDAEAEQLKKEKAASHQTNAGPGYSTSRNASSSRGRCGREEVDSPLWAHLLSCEGPAFSRTLPTELI